MREGTWLPWASMGKGGQGVRANGMSTGYTESTAHSGREEFTGSPGVAAPFRGLL